MKMEIEHHKHLNKLSKTMEERINTAKEEIQRQFEHMSKKSSILPFDITDVKDEIIKDIKKDFR